MGSTEWTCSNHPHRQEWNAVILTHISRDPSEIDGETSPAMLTVVAGKDREKGDKNTMERNNKHVLVVDDDCDLRYMLSLRLVSAGYMVYGAANGLEAFEQIEKHSIDAVLTDYRMPKMDGFEFLSICHVKWPGIPVVVFSAEQDDLAYEAVERGAFAWVRKGSEFTMLLEILDTAVQQSVHA
jgi:CheY-like chemotaxis protein